MIGEDGDQLLAILEAILARAEVTLGTWELIDQVIAPLMAKIGDLWSEDGLSPGHPQSRAKHARWR